MAKRPPLTLEEEQTVFARALLVSLGVYEFYKDYLKEVNDYNVAWFRAGKPLKQLHQNLIDCGAQLVAEFDQQRVVAMASANTLH